MDGGLRKLFRKHLPAYHWVSIESGGTGGGIPDSEYCAPGGITGWIEYKKATAWKLDYNLDATQVAWHLRRARNGGRSFIAVRRQHGGGPRKGPPVDELWLHRGTAAPSLREYGLMHTYPDSTIRYLGVWPNGPAAWNWKMIDKFLRMDS